MEVCEFGIRFLRLLVRSRTDKPLHNVGGKTRGEGAGRTHSFSSATV
jgi:hypothetical protein